MAMSDTLLGEPATAALWTGAHGWAVGRGYWVSVGGGPVVALWSPLTRPLPLPSPSRRPFLLLAAFGFMLFSTFCFMAITFFKLNKKSKVFGYLTTAVTTIAALSYLIMALGRTAMTIDGGR
jgi:hypothetical protein